MTDTLAFDDTTLLGGAPFYINRPFTLIPFDPPFGGGSGSTALRPMIGGRVIYLSPTGQFMALPEAT